MKPLLIMGPTASGKSALALALAETLGGVIINADASQVYRDLRVLSARPSAAELARAPHQLYGFVDAGARYSTGQWLDDAMSAIRAAREAKRQAILVGGTGLYFKALTEGLVAAPEIPAAVRAELGQELERYGVEELHARLAAEDAARIRPTDVARVLRALEILEVTGGSLRELQAATPPPPLAAWAGLALTPSREAVYAATDARFEAMLAAGALAEARALAGRGLDPELPAMKALGAPWLLAHLRGELALEQAVALAKRDTRRYAKRQFTWIAGQMRAWTQVEAQDVNIRAAAARALLDGIDGNVSAN